MIAIINYGMGNLTSVEKAFNRIGVKAVVTNEQSFIKNCDKIVLPGVGHFKTGMERLESSGLKNLLEELVLVKKKPILGICLGMQLFTSHSEEGNTNGLGWISGNTTFFGSLGTAERHLPVPHMGWNQPQIVNNHPILTNISADSTFYFVHSYRVNCNSPENVIAASEYGIKFHSIIAKENIVGVQFHPEKSHSAGLNLLKNFTNLC